MDMADSISEDLKEKGNKLRDLSGIPIIGSFAETKGNEVLDQADQIVDLRQETQQYQDDLNVSRNRLMGNREKRDYIMIMIYKLTSIPDISLSKYQNMSVGE